MGYALTLLFTSGEDHLELDHDSEFMTEISLDDSLRCSSWGISLAMEKVHAISDFSQINHTKKQISTFK